MTTAYTSLLGLALPVTGELSGTWGDTVNDSITSLLDSAVAGTTTISSDADVTLTTTTGASNTSRQAILLWTAGGTVTRNITAPAQSKIYTVINKSSSTQSIVLRGAGPTTGVTIVQGESAVCAWNGSDFIKISNTSGAGVFTTLSVSGAVTLSGGTANGVAYLNGSKVLTTGSALTWNATNFSIIPNAAGSYTNTINLSGSQSNGTKGHIGQFADGLYLTSNYYYDSAQSVDTATYGVAGISLVAGTTTTSYIAFGITAAGGSGLSEKMRISGQTGGVGAVGIGYTSLTSVGDNGLAVLGNVGIGTSSPAYKLDVSKATAGDVARFTNGGASNKSLFVYTDATYAAIATGVGASGNGIAFDAVNNKVLFTTASTNQMFLDSSGNLGLGVTPSGWFTSNNLKAVQLGGGSVVSYLNNQVWLASNYYLNSSGQDTYVGTGASNRLIMDGAYKFNIAPSGTAGNPISFTQAMTLDASGNLMVGVTSALGKFTVLQGSSSNGDTVVLKASSASAAGSQPGVKFLSNADANLAQVFADVNSGALITNVNGSERARIDSSGNLLVGGTSNARSARILSENTAGQQLGIRYTGVATWYQNVDSAGELSWDKDNSEKIRINNNGCLLIGSSSAPAAPAGTIVPLGYRGREGTGGTEVNNFNIAWNGSGANLWIDTTNQGAITTSSDYRIKKNVETQTAPAIERVMRLRPVTYELKDYGDLFKADGVQREGFIAHEVQNVIPSGAEGIKDEENRIQSLKVDAILSVVVKAIQEQQAIITQLTARITALESA